jgi:hypothetical protein
MDITMSKAGPVNIAVLNLLGQVVYEQSETYHSGINNQTLDLSGIEKGFYMLRVSGNEQKMMSRILIE